MNEGVLLTVRGLKKYFPITGGILFKTVAMVRAVDGVDFSIRKGETFSLVGETGCGKTTTGLLILRLLEKTSGEVLYNGQNIFELKGDELRRLRCQMQMIYQDPYSSLDPRMKVGDIIGEPLKIHGITKNRGEREDQVRELMNRVGLSDEHINRYPHEFSGGQRQRIGIARALSVNPGFIVADEPVSSLDVSVRAQILNLMKDLQEELKLTYLFISHDLSAVRYVSDVIGVMYAGKIVEIARRNDLFEYPLHPYTQALLSSIPIPNPKKARMTRRVSLSGEIPSPLNPPSGCRFHTRCPLAYAKCAKIEPALIEYREGHYVACHLYA